MGEETEIRNLHLAYFLDLAEKADKELRGYHQLEWLRSTRIRIATIACCIRLGD